MIKKKLQRKDNDTYTYAPGTILCMKPLRHIHICKLDHFLGVEGRESGKVHFQQKRLCFEFQPLK